MCTKIHLKTHWLYDSSLLLSTILPYSTSILRSRTDRSQGRYRGSVLRQDIEPRALGINCQAFHLARTCGEHILLHQLELHVTAGNRRPCGSRWGGRWPTGERSHIQIKDAVVYRVSNI